MWYSILARSVRNDFLFPSWLLIVGIVIQLAEAVLATLLRSFFGDGIRHMYFNMTRTN